jgi:hypothetical protein
MNIINNFWGADLKCGATFILKHTYPYMQSMEKWLGFCKTDEYIYGQYKVDKKKFLFSGLYKQWGWKQ